MLRTAILRLPLLAPLLITTLSSPAADAGGMEASTIELAPPTAAELALAEVPGHPGAPAVILTKRAELRLGDGAGSPSSFAVAVRLKVLTEAGKAYGQVTVGHGDAIRLEHFAGVTLTPGGERVPLPAGAVFQERRGARRVTKAAFPAVEVGAIVDYGYRLSWSSGAFYEPWYLDDRLPTLYSVLIYHEHRGRSLTHRARDPDDRLRVEIEERADGRIVRVVGANLPPVVEEPHGFAFADLAHRVLITTGDGGWHALCARIEEGAYAPARRFDRNARARARELVRGLREPEQRIDALYRFVRDRVRVEKGSGILPNRDVTVDLVLETGRGTAADAALLLQSMLAAAKIPARLVWASDWRDGESDLAVPSPGWFERVLVAAGPRRAPIFLDPGERGLATGRLTPLQEGTKALICDDPPAVVELPRTPASGSLRRAVLDLALDEDGRVHGHGTLRLTGHHAWYLLRRRESPETTTEGWRRWLEERLPGHDVAAVTVDERVDDQRIDVVWSMAQRPADVLGDEASLDPGRPLGPVEQRYTIPPDRRRTPVRVSFADRDELELRLVWPAGWDVELAPPSRRHESVAGGFETRLERDDETRRLVYRRGFEITETVFPPGPPYAALRELYAELERHDAQMLVLVQQ